VRSRFPSGPGKILTLTLRSGATVSTSVPHRKTPLCPHRGVFTRPQYTLGHWACWQPVEGRLTITARTSRILPLVILNSSDMISGACRWQSRASSRRTGARRRWKGELQLGEGDRAIARDLTLSRRSVTKYRQRAGAISRPSRSIDPRPRPAGGLRTQRRGGGQRLESQESSHLIAHHRPARTRLS
jgi:hypothetical protein